jgi:hypothetical protein
MFFVREEADLFNSVTAVRLCELIEVFIGIRSRRQEIGRVMCDGAQTYQGVSANMSSR